MKIAVCYRGQLRTISYTYENHVKNLLLGHDVDFFCHTWKENSDQQIRFVKDVILPKSILAEESKNFQLNPYSAIYDKSDYINSFEIDRRISENGLHVRPYNCLSMLYSIQQSNFLCKLFSQENDVLYDLVISMRPDIFFYGYIDLNAISKDDVNISWFKKEGDILDAKNAIIDHVAISSQENMNIYSDCFSFLPYQYFCQKSPMIPECMLGSNLKTAGKHVRMISQIHTVIRENNVHE